MYIIVFPFYSLGQFEHEQKTANEMHDIEML